MMPHPAQPTLLLAALLVGLTPRPGRAEDALPSAPVPTPEQVRFFEARVRPVLAENCQKCHGPQKQKSGLRLDSRAAALAGGDSGPAVVPGQPGESLLVAAVSHEDELLKMPPAKKLDPQQVADLTHWVEIGAPWPAGAEAAAPPRGEFQIRDADRAHWAFRPIRRPPVPEVRDRTWAQNPIDAFLLAGLEAQGLRPNPPATKHELIRRVSYDLTGLPPTPEEVGAFLADDSPGAYEALIDRLLASPRYGEQWGRHWLDLVRFAETNSYERDNPKPGAWRYRDYVIRSFNRDTPFDRFTREQLAGDELPDGGIDGRIATGYYRLGIWDDEPTDRAQAEFDGLDDLVATTGGVFLGLTIDCARCHDHKLDPIPQKDYYRLLAFFRNITPYRNGGPTDEAPIFTSAAEEDAYAQEARALGRTRAEVQSALAALEDEFRARAGLAPASRPDLEGLHYAFYRDTWDRLPDFAALKPEDVGRLPGGLFDLSPRTRDDAFGFVFEGELIVPRDGTYTFDLDSDDGSRLIIGGRTVAEHDGLHDFGQGKTAAVALAQGRVPIRLEYFQGQGGSGLRVGWSGPGFGRRPLSLAPGEPRPTTAADVSRRIREDGARVLGPEAFGRYQTLRRELQELIKHRVPGPKALCVTEAGPVAPPTFVLLRGNAHVPGDPVEPAFPEVLGAASPAIPPPAPGARTTGRRRVLADWIASADNPLTARVLANRVWQHHFGRGIVRSPSNFGLQGDRPTHPELLDWLASELIRQGWHLKPLHRLILTSNAYRMSARADARGLALDPANDRFWRFDMRRLFAEEIRDSILAVSGTLNPKMDGPGIYPEIPPEVLAGQSVPGKGWGHSPPGEQARRSVYIHVKRSLLVPILEGFDLAETDRSSPVRFSTTQPTQALALLNGAFLNRQAAALAARLRREAGAEVAAQVRLALRLATAREPGEAEVRRGVELIAALRTHEGLGADEALRMCALMVLNLNEFLYLD